MSNLDLEKKWEKEEELTEVYALRLLHERRLFYVQEQDLGHRGH